MKTLGIIGGFGPEATATFQLEIIRLLHDEKIRPAVLAWNTPVPLRIEHNLIMHGKNLEEFLPLLIEGAKKLEKAGAELLVIPCNTLHLLWEKVQDSVSIPLLNIAEETAIFMDNQRAKEVMLLGTKQTIISRLHSQKLEAHHIKTIIPSSIEQRVVDNFIHCLLRNKAIHISKNRLASIVNHYKQLGCHDVLLACTDLQLDFPQVRGVRVHDTMKILATATTRKMLE